MRIRIEAPARREIKSAADWYFERDSSLAGDFLREIRNAAERACANPGIYRVRMAELRYCRVDRFPYHIVFRDKGNEGIDIYAIAHFSRKPLYWKDRS